MLAGGAEAPLEPLVLEGDRLTLAARPREILTLRVRFAD